MADGAAAVALETLTGDRLRAALPDLARLRIAVFRSFPYLYDGDAAYEEKYLATYAEAEGSIVVAAKAGDRIVGAATGLPLMAETENIVEPLRRAGQPVDRIFYFGESLLDQAYRGRGIGVGFFAAREAQARTLGLPICVFCAVVRPEDHPARPRGYTPLDRFWRNRGYRPMDGIACTIAWRDVGDDRETEKPLAFWSKTLPDAG